MTFPASGVCLLPLSQSLFHLQSQQLLQGRTDSILDLFLLLEPVASWCFCSLKGYCPYIMTCLGTPCPSARMLKQNAFVRDPVHLWMAIGRMILTYPLPELAILGDICKINGLFTLCPHLSHLCSIQESGIQTPQDGYFERLVCHFSISKLSEYSHIPCLNTSSLGFIILCVASRVSFNNSVAVFLLMHYSDTDSFPASLFYFLGPF